MTVRILTGDALETLRTLPDGAFQCCVTSPPYYGLRSYLPDGHPDKHLEVGLDDTPEAYVARLVEVFREVRRVLRDDATLWLNLGDSFNNFRIGQIGQSVHGHDARDKPTQRRRGASGYKEKDLLGIPWMVAFALRADGWWLRRDIIWSKPSCMPESVTDRPTSAHEYVFLLTKAPRYYYDAESIKETAVGVTGGAPIKSRDITAGPVANGNSGLASGWTGSESRNARSVWTIATQPFSASSIPGWASDHDHFAVMPPELAERCIKAGTSERGACPHCGAPWERVVFKQRTRDGKPLEGGYNSATAHRIGPTGVGHWRDRTETQTAGWAASCTCPPHEPVPCAVLDPFGGAGTTALVADRLRRDATIIELNPRNVELARARIVADAPLLVAAE